MADLDSGDATVGRRNEFMKQPMDLLMDHLLGKTLPGPQDRIFTITVPWRVALANPFAGCTCEVVMTPDREIVYRITGPASRLHVLTRFDQSPMGRRRRRRRGAVGGRR